MIPARTRKTRTRLKNTHVRAKILARARAAARPMDQKCRMINPSRSRSKEPQPQRVGVECPDPLCHLGKLLYASKSLQRIHGLWSWDRPTRASLPAHPRGKASCELVRDYLRELHDRWRATAACARSDTGALSRRPAWCFHVFRIA